MTQVANFLDLLDATGDDEDARLSDRLRAVMDEVDSVEAPFAAADHSHGWVDADTTPAELQAKVDVGPVVFMEDMTVANQQTIDLGRDGIKFDLNGYTFASDADPVFSVDASHLSVLFGNISASAGHCFDVTGLSMSSFLQLFINQVGDRSVVRCVEGDMYDTLFQGGEWQSGFNEALSVPMFDVATNNARANTNTVRRLRMQTNGNSGAPSAPCISLESTQVDNWVYGWTIADINFEIADAGGVHLKGCKATVLDHLQFFDNTGSITDHLIHLTKGASGSGLNCQGTTIRDFFRGQGSLNSSVYDIYSEHHYAGSCLIDNPIANSGAQAKIAGTYVLRGGAGITEV